MTWNLFLDDIRNPKIDPPDGGRWVIARSYADAIHFITYMGMPKYVSFDHDLGDSGEDTGYDLAKWFVKEDLDGLRKLPKDFSFNVHSANPVGAKNIQTILDNYLKFREK